MRRSIHCVSSGAFWVMPADKRVGVPFRMFLTDAPLRLWAPTEDGDRIVIHFVARQRLEVYRDRELAEFRCRTREYSYTVSDADLHETVRWHWHPDTHPAPHVHVAGFRGHIPSGRVTFESVVRFLIEEMKADPSDERWDEVLTTEEGRHREFRTWH